MKRGNGGRSGSWGSAVLVALWSGFAISAPGVSSNFESGTLLRSDAPPGEWDQYIEDTAANTAQVIPEAARSGSYGFRLTDSDGSAGSGGQNALSVEVDSASGTFHLRTWFRVTGFNDLGSFAIAQIFSDADGGQPLAELGYSAGSVCHWSYDRVWGRGAQCNSLNPTADNWHFMELEVLGVGTNAGTSVMTIDGARKSAGGKDWTGLSVDHVRLGAPASEDRAFIGLLDFDDLVAAPGPLGTLSIDPASAIVRPGGTLGFKAFGGYPPYTFTLDSAPSDGSITQDGAYLAGPIAGGTDVIRVTDDMGGTLTASVDVNAASPDHVRLLPVGPLQVDACALATVEASVVDVHGNVVEEPSVVTVCAEHSATVVASTLGNEVRNGTCVTGELLASGRATVTFENDDSGSVVVTGTQTGLPGQPETVTLTWEAAGISPVPDCRSQGPILPLNLVVGCDCGSVPGSSYVPLASLFLLTFGMRSRRSRG